MPASTVAANLERLGDKDRPVLVYCASGTRSMLAVRRLKAAGFTRVVDLATIHNAMALPRGGRAD